MKKAVMYSVAFILAFYVFGFIAEINRVENGWSEMQGGILMLVGVMAVLGLYIASNRKN